MKLLIIYLFLSLNSYALELDSFTNRHIPLEDSLEAVDAFTNKKLRQAIDAANHAGEIFNSKCSYKILRRKVKRKLVADLRGVYVIAPLEHYIDSKDIGRQYLVTTKKKESIYKYIKMSDKPLMLIPPFAPLTISNGSHIGSDKYSHFFNLGYLYYRKLEHGYSIKDILKHGLKSEKSIWGGIVNGIISNADLVANFQGLRFYQQLFGKGIDPLTGHDYEGDGAIKCINGEFKLTRAMTFADFIDDAMDEAINCNEYSSRKVATKVKRRIDELGMKCPMEEDKCAQIGLKYQKFGKYLLYGKCVDSSDT